MTKFKPGDKIRRKHGVLGCTEDGIGTVIATPKVTYPTTNKVFFKDEIDGGHFWVGEDLVELVVEYEDAWVLNDGKQFIPEDAKTLKDDTGDVVAFKRVKKPKVVEYFRYYTKEGCCYDKPTLSTKKMATFVEVDGVLTEVLVSDVS